MSKIINDSYNQKYSIIVIPFVDITTIFEGKVWKEKLWNMM
jgi:hypothetical protein